MTQLSYEMFNIVNDFVEQIQSDAWMTGKSQICLLGGIMINCDSEACDMFLPLKFEVRKKDGTKIDFLNEVFPNSIEARKKYM